MPRPKNVEKRRTHELEKPRDPFAPEKDFILDLYLPIEEK
jgi:hypothetical protein